MDVLTNIVVDNASEDCPLLEDERELSSAAIVLKCLLRGCDKN